MATSTDGPSALPLAPGSGSNSRIPKYESLGAASYNDCISTSGLSGFSPFSLWDLSTKDWHVPRWENIQDPGGCSHLWIKWCCPSRRPSAKALGQVRAPHSTKWDSRACQTLASKWRRMQAKGLAANTLPTSASVSYRSHPATLPAKQKRQGVRSKEVKCILTCDYPNDAPRIFLIAPNKRWHYSPTSPWNVLKEQDIVDISPFHRWGCQGTEKQEHVSGVTRCIPRLLRKWAQLPWRLAVLYRPSRHRKRTFLEK